MVLWLGFVFDLRDTSHGGLGGRNYEGSRREHEGRRRGFGVLFGGKGCHYETGGVEESRKRGGLGLSPVSLG